MTMNTLSRSRTFSPAGIVPWTLKLATRMLARSFNMPEPLVHHTGVFVFCPGRLLRQLRNWRRRSER
jgi:hypothetical protein